MQKREKASSFLDRDFKIDPIRSPYSFHPGELREVPDENAMNFKLRKGSVSNWINQINYYSSQENKKVELGKMMETIRQADYLSAEIQIARVPIEPFQEFDICIGDGEEIGIISAIEIVKLFQVSKKDFENIVSGLPCGTEGSMQTISNLLKKEVMIVLNPRCKMSYFPKI